MAPRSDFQLSFPGVPRGRSQSEIDTFHASQAPKPPTDQEAREQRKRQNVGAVVENQDMRSRSYDADSMGESTGGTSGTGEVDTEDLGLVHDGPVPRWASFRGSRRSAWRTHGSVEEVPIVGAHTEQETVSAERFRQARDDPSTRANPRFHGMSPDLPRVYHEAASTPEHDNYHIVDGNHRVTSSLARGEMFQPARVLRSHQQQAVQAHNMRINEAQANVEARNLQAHPALHGGMGPASGSYGHMSPTGNHWVEDGQRHSFLRDQS